MVKQATDCEYDVTSEEEEEEIDMATIPDSLKAGVALSHEAGKEDKAGNYERAIQLYLETEKCFFHALQYDKSVEQNKDELYQACQEYRKRVNEILLYFEEATTNKKHNG